RTISYNSVRDFIQAVFNNVNMKLCSVYVIETVAWINGSFIVSIYTSRYGMCRILKNFRFVRRRGVVGDFKSPPLVWIR
ncbi:hypothetical protein L9F63_009406, partial [Diploptera punctata]